MGNKRTSVDKGSHAKSSPGYCESYALSQIFDPPTSGLCLCFFWESSCNPLPGERDYCKASPATAYMELLGNASKQAEEMVKIEVLGVCDS
jgi:hypothetical protein